jgi:hypothetical protein
MVNNALEALGYALIVSFLWFVWPPLVLIGAGLLLVMWANARDQQGKTGARIGAMVSAARQAYRAQREAPVDRPLRSVG